MAKESMKAREVKRAKLVAKYAAKRAALKADRICILWNALQFACSFIIAAKLQVAPKAILECLAFQEFNFAKWLQAV